MLLARTRFKGLAVNLGNSERPEEQWLSAPPQGLTLSLPPGFSDPQFSVC